MRAGAPPVSASRRPWLLRVLPPRVREWLVYAWYLRGAPARTGLFHGATLALAPHVRMDLSPTDVGHAVIALAGTFETRLTRRIWRLARRGGLLVDVGANYGYYSLLWAAARPDNRVVALEASPRNIGPLSANIGRNRCAARIAVVPAAAGRESGTVTLDLGPPDQTGWGGIAAAGAAHTALVPAVRLDDLAATRGIERIDVLKIDVEGADGWVLQGAEDLLRRRRVAQIFFERNDPRMTALGIAFADTERLLAAVGYRWRRLTAHEWQAWPAP